ncbi:hypothetical protein HY440_02845 [Candidatus Microgenomates bacterium]|nr:hypothetical protein [Candidatus Microgenomates bacterium]
MFSYQQISRWLKTPIDPVTVEDWVANREIFGSSKDDPELELAFEIETVRNGDLGKAPEDGAPLELLLNGYELANFWERGDYLIVAPTGVAAPGELWIYGEKVEKKDLPARAVTTIEIDPKRQTKIKLRLQKDFRVNGKNNFEWSGTGKTKVVFDMRGRPLPL